MLGPMKQGDLFATERAYKQVRATLLKRPENPAVIVRHLKKVIRECIVPSGRELVVRLTGYKRPVPGRVTHAGRVARLSRGLDNSPLSVFYRCGSGVYEDDVDGLAELFTVVAPNGLSAYQPIGSDTFLLSNQLLASKNR